MSVMYVKEKSCPRPRVDCTNITGCTTQVHFVLITVRRISFVKVEMHNEPIRVLVEVLDP